MPMILLTILQISISYSQDYLYSHIWISVMPVIPWSHWACGFRWSRKHQSIKLTFPSAFTRVTSAGCLSASSLTPGPASVMTVLTCVTREVFQMWKPVLQPSKPPLLPVLISYCRIALLVYLWHAYCISHHHCKYTYFFFVFSHQGYMLGLGDSSTDLLFLAAIYSHSFSILL